VSVYATSDDVYKYLGRIFEMAFEDPELAAKLYETKTTMTLHYKNPDSTIFIDWGNGKVQFGDDATAEPDVHLYMESDTAHRFWLGKVNVPVAMAKGQIKTRGAVAKVLKIAPMMKPLFSKYEGILRDNGLEHLITA
jgi:putative sterol carrier protein